MAVSFVAHEVSDLCIGKPALRQLPLSATVADALRSLKRCGETYLSVWTSTNSSPPSCVGKVCFVDVICFLCSDDNISDPSSALRSPVSVLLQKGLSNLVRPVDPHSSILEALDVILEGAQNLVVPIKTSSRRKGLAGGGRDFCCLTQEDFVRFFLDSIGHFSPVPALSVQSLGIVRTDVLAIRYHNEAISAIPLLKQAVGSQTAVAVVTDDGKLIGEISPSTLAFFGRGEAAVAAAVAALSSRELMAYIDCGSPPEEAVLAVKARLREKGLKGMLELMEDDGDDVSSISSSSSSATSSSSSDEESSQSSASTGRKRLARTYSRSGSYSARMGRRSEEAIVCHPESSLVAVMMQALAHRVSYVWVVEDDYELAGVVTFPDILRVFRDQIVQ